MARGGDVDALDILLRRYTSYARSKARTYFLVGADREDIVQEGMIGLFKAIRDFDASKTVSFRSFAELCITRQIITAIKTATRQKHTPLNSYVSLHRPVMSDDEGERQLSDFLASAQVIDPVELVVAEDEVAQIRAFLAGILSDLETEVLRMYLQGKSYQDIAVALRRQAKSIDNALQRIKRKLEQFLRERERAAEEAGLSDRVVRVGPFNSPGEVTADVRNDGRDVALELSLELQRLRQRRLESAGLNGNGHAKTNGNGHAKTNGNGHAKTNGNGKVVSTKVASGSGKAPRARVAAPTAGRTKSPARKSATKRAPARKGDLRAGLRFAVAAVKAEPKRKAAKRRVRSR